VKDAAYKWLKLASDNKKIIAIVLVFFFGGGGLGYGTSLYVNTGGTSEIANETNNLTPDQPLVGTKPCICQCGITKHLKKAH